MTSSLTLMGGAEALEIQIVALGEEEPHKAFLIAHKLSKIAERLKKDYQEKAVEYYEENHELPAGYSMKSSSTGKKYAFEQDEKWQILKGKMDAREALLIKASTAPVSIKDPDGDTLPRITWKEGTKYTFSQS